MRDYWPLVIVGLLLLGAGVYRIRRLDRWRRVVELVLVLGGAVACAAVLAATTLPLISLLEGTWRR
jgi:predicted transporter